MSDPRWWYLWMLVVMVLYICTLWLLEPVRFAVCAAFVYLALKD